MECKKDRETDVQETTTGDGANQDILEEIEIEDLTVDGICGVY